MSAESHRKPSREKSVGKVVLPQVVEDKSLIDSFAGFIQDVVPQAYGCSLPSESKEKILWARFEYSDLNDPIFYTDAVEPVSVGPPILLVLGYTFGVQVWGISVNGEATELLSWFHGTAKFFKLLPSPLTDPNQKQDPFTHRRPLAAVCDGASSPQFCSINFLSLRGGDVVKSIKFKTSVLDIAVNRISVVVSFLEKIAIFNALTLDNRHTITTCYASPGFNLNPIALGPRWLAYAEQRLIPYLKSAGGCESESAPSYTATVLNAAKTLSQGLRELSGSVASSLSGNLSTSPVSHSHLPMVSGFHRSDSSTSINCSSSGELLQPGIVTIVDVECKLSDDESERKNGIVAHFVAHPESIVALNFDTSGVLLLTADRKGHRFHVFRIQPHLLGSSYASVHHLYVLYRGDTSAKVQDMTFSIDSRWVAVSSLRGTTHVFPVTPYGGPIGKRTHSTPHVVNKYSRFHRSAGIVAEGRNSPVPHETLPLSSSPTSMSFPNPCLPPFPHPTVLMPLAQIRNQSTLLPQSRHSSPQSQDESCLPALKVVACFAPPRTLDGLLTVHSAAPYPKSKNAVDSLYIMSSHGTLTEYDLEPVPAIGIPKDKQNDESAIELKVEPKVQWCMLQLPLPSACSSAIEPPLGCGNPLLATYSSMKQEFVNLTTSEKSYQIDDEEKWLSQVEIVTHVGPHRRIWMGPQFTFKSLQKNVAGDLEPADLNIAYTAKSNPVNMPTTNAKNQAAPPVPFYIESGSSSSLEQSPRLVETYGGDSDSSVGVGELKIQEDIADAMIESPMNAALKNEVSDSEIVDDSLEKHSGKKNRRTKKKRR